MANKIGIIDVGGGFRGAYAAGVFDYCLDHGVTFDLGIGVSAGSANLASFAAGQARRNYKFYTEYGMRKEYASLRNFIKTKSFIGLDYIYGTLSNSNGEYPLDYQAIIENPMEFIVVATEAETGKVKYFDKSDLYLDNYHIFKASSAIPYVCRPYTIDGIPYYDGALADPVPIEKAFLMGCDKVIVILTLPENKIRPVGKDNFLAARIEKEYPFAANELKNRAMKYNAGVMLGKYFSDKGKVLIISPDDTCNVSTLSRKPESIIKLYNKGYKDGKAISTFINCQN